MNKEDKIAELLEFFQKEIELRNIYIGWAYHYEGEAIRHQEELAELGVHVEISGWD